LHAFSSEAPYAVFRNASYEVGGPGGAGGPAPGGTAGGGEVLQPGLERHLGGSFILRKCSTFGLLFFLVVCTRDAPSCAVRWPARVHGDGLGVRAGTATWTVCGGTHTRLRLQFYSLFQGGVQPKKNERHDMQFLQKSRTGIFGFSKISKSLFFKQSPEIHTLSIREWTRTVSKFPESPLNLGNDSICHGAFVESPREFTTVHIRWGKVKNSMCSGVQKNGATPQL
jgi:hypothetical protein